MHEELLIKAGMSLRETKIYTALLTNGESMASGLSNKTGIIRTNVYDILNSLIKKGVASYIIRSGKKYFMATEPEKLVDYINSRKDELDETKAQIQKIFPELKPMHSKPGRPSIEIYEGREGMKTILEMSIRESLRTRKEILGISVQQQKCRKLAGSYHIRWYNSRAKNKIKSRYLMSAEEK